MKASWKLFVCFAFVVLLLPGKGISQSQNLFEISKNLDIFTTLYKQLDINYVDEIKPGELMKTGIDAMLETLDPFTNYIPESDIEDYRFMTTGQYGGIGALIHRKGDNIYISEPYKGFAADKAGLIAGDKVLEINGTSTTAKSVDDVSAILKGQPGSNIKLLIQRDEGKPFEVSVSRETIQVESIPYYGMLNKNTGYIKLNSFTQNVGQEVKEAFMKLKEKNELKGLVFDLRGNGGGLLNEAVNIANIFVDKDQLIVSTKGRLPMSNNTYKTQSGGADMTIPLTFIVDKNSASASEILAGSMQDLDRAVIIGQRSYGKGLVQNVLPLSYNCQVKITVAKYYIPSGRCIQAIDYSHKDAEGNFGHIPDSLITAFKTKSGRPVYDGGGIEPDVVMDPAKLSGIAQALLSKYLIFDYATAFKKAHTTIEPAKDFHITDDIYNDFIKFLKGKDYDDYVTTSDRFLEEFKKSAVREKSFETIKPEYEALKDRIKQSKAQEILTNKDDVMNLLRDEIVTRYYYQRGRIEASLASDPEIIKAVEVIDNKNLYTSILAGTFKKPEGDKIGK